MITYTPGIVFLAVVIFAWCRVFYFRKQLILRLLRVELIILGLFLGYVFIMGDLGKRVALTFYLLVLGACEASLGLSLLVVLTRYLGRDILNSRAIC